MLHAAILLRHHYNECNTVAQQYRVGLKFRRAMKHYYCFPVLCDNVEHVYHCTTSSPTTIFNYVGIYLSVVRHRSHTPIMG